MSQVASPGPRFEVGAEPVGAILNPFSEMPAPSGRTETAARGVTHPEEASLTATVLSALGGLAIFGCLLRLVVNGA